MQIAFNDEVAPIKGGGAVDVGEVVVAVGRRDILHHAELKWLDDQLGLVTDVEAGVGKIVGVSPDLSTSAGNLNKGLIYSQGIAPDLRALSVVGISVATRMANEV